MKNFLYLMILTMAVTGCINQVDESKVVLKVGSKTYSNDDISDRIGIANDPSVKAYFESKENREKLVDQIIEEEVIYQLAKKERLQRNKEFKTRMDQLERQALIQFYIQQNVDEIVEVTPDEVETFYNSNKSIFSEYETRNLSHILVATKKEANRVQRLLKKGKKFDDLARQYSTDESKANGGNLGWVRKDRLVEEFGTAAFRLSKRAPVSGVVKTSFGYHIIKLNDVSTVKAQPLDDVYEKISTQLLAQKRQQKFNDLMSNAKETFTIEKTLENL